MVLSFQINDVTVQAQWKDDTNVSKEILSNILNIEILAAKSMPLDKVNKVVLSEKKEEKTLSDVDVEQETEEENN
jgi:hypothetical protein